MKKKLAGILFIAVMGFAVSASAGVLTLDAAPNFTLDGGAEPNAIVTPFNYSGTTVGGPTFNRPLANGNAAPTALSAVGTAVSYDVVMFTVATTGSYIFQSTSVSPAAWDNYTVLYSGVFNAASPLTGALIANDDNPSIGLSGFTYTLTAGTQYSFVTTGYANTDAGSFNDSITRAVPEPGTWAMMGAGFVGLVAVQRLRRRAA